MLDGADLWVLPSLQVSEWTRQLDWPLNLMVTRAHHHLFPELPAQLRKITMDIEMKISRIPEIGPNRPLLVAKRRPPSQSSDGDYLRHEFRSMDQVEPQDLERPLKTIGSIFSAGFRAEVAHRTGRPEYRSC